MSGGELAVVLASVAVVVAAAVLGALGVGIARSLRELRRLLGEIRRDVLPAVKRIEEASGQVTGEVQRVGGLLDVAEAVSQRAESLSKVTYRAAVEPLAAAAGLFRRGHAKDAGTFAKGAADRGASARGAVVPGWAKAAAASSRTSWTRRAAAYLLRSGYRAATARLAARFAAASAQRSATTTTSSADNYSETPATGTAPDLGTRRSGTDGVSWERQLSEAVREVTNEISAALEEGRQRIQAERNSERNGKGPAR